MVFRIEAEKRTSWSLESRVEELRNEIKANYKKIINSPDYIVHKLIDSGVSITLEYAYFEFHDRLIGYHYVVVKCPFSDILRELRSIGPKSINHGIKCYSIKYLEDNPSTEE